MFVVFGDFEMDLFGLQLTLSPSLASELWWACEYKPKHHVLMVRVAWLVCLRKQVLALNMKHTYLFGSWIVHNRFLHKYFGAVWQLLLYSI